MNNKIARQHISFKDFCKLVYKKTNQKTAYRVWKDENLTELRGHYEGVVLQLTDTANKEIKKQNNIFYVKYFGKRLVIIATISALIYTVIKYYYTL